MKKSIAWLAATCMLATAIAGFAYAYSLASPDRRPVGSLPGDLAGRSIQFAGASGTALRGWYVPGEPGGGTILLLHGVHSSRMQMVDRARFLRRAGYSSLLYDSRAHGESDGDAITFGQLESQDARRAVQLARSLAPGDPVGVIGVSLGGAAALLAEPRLDVQAIVAESVYPSIDRAVSDRLRNAMGAPGPLFSPVLLSMLPVRLGFPATRLRPIDHVRGLRTPKFFIFGSADRYTMPQESIEMFDAAAEPKQMWEVAGAAHVDLCAFSGRAYEARVLDFLNRYLRSRDR